MFSPTQFGLALLLPAIFTASRSPSLKSGDDRVKAACALASCEPQNAASASALARIEPRKSMTSPSDFLSVVVSSFGQPVSRQVNRFPQPPATTARTPSTPHP